MSAVIARYPRLFNAIIVATTVLFVTLALTVARAEAEPELQLAIGDPAPADFVATDFVEVEDAAATQVERENAVRNTPSVFRINATVASDVEAEIRRFFFAIREGARGVEPPNTSTTIVGPDDTTTTTATTVAPTTTTTVAPTTTTTVAAVAGQEGADTTTTTVAETTTTIPPTTTTTLPRISEPGQIANLEFQYQRFRDAIPALIAIHELHVDDIDAGGDGFFDRVEEVIVSTANDLMSVPLTRSDVDDRVEEVLLNPPRQFVPEVAGTLALQLDDAAAEVIAVVLEANREEDTNATALARQAASDAVETVLVDYRNGETIVGEGGIVTAVQLDAIDELGLLAAPAGTSRAAAAALGGIAVLIAALFLWRIAPGQWSQPKHMALLGVLLIVAAVVSRLPQLIAVENPELSYVIPAAMLGYAAAILYEPRTALLTALPMAIFTAISTESAALTIFAAAATVAPIAFVSAVSTRRQLRSAVLLGALVLAPIAASVSWFFVGRDTAVEAAAAGFAGGIIGGFIGQGLVSFLENLFRITTTVTLLDLTDRNHPALRLIEDRAPGTFNHSILVGNLAGRAARAIDADPLFAQAAAFYHDLGKTENPQYFIENQFGVSNPHDELDPAESAKIIGQHVTDGLRLARQYRIPTDVAAGIEQHHGCGLMRYFYHQALDADPAVDPSLFRHHGKKPQRKEMAILMISDAVEGAARALAQQEDPTGDSLKKLVDSVVGEKLEDGQLDESALTFGDLTRVKQAIVEALIGYYHTRISYPGFPGGPTNSS